jgi:NADH-ubiquinone oxidoreductase chain 2
LFSSLLSLVIGTIVGLTQSRIKRLYAFSTISHVGFILLSLSIHTIESTQAFIFYLMQYSISNLNAFILIITIGYTLYFYINNPEDVEQTMDDFGLNTKDKEDKYNFPMGIVSFRVVNDILKSESSGAYTQKQNEKLKKIKVINNLQDVNNSPIQLIDQLRGYYNINPFISLSLAITLFSFAGIPPLLGFFGKQMVLSAAIDNGYIFMSLVAILTSVISAVYYLIVIKEIFFYRTDYIINP